MYHHYTYLIIFIQQVQNINNNANANTAHDDIESQRMRGSAEHGDHIDEMVDDNFQSEYRMSIQPMMNNFYQDPIAPRKPPPQKRRSEPMVTIYFIKILILRQFS